MSSQCWPLSLLLSKSKEQENIILNEIKNKIAEFSKLKDKGLLKGHLLEKQWITVFQ